jgi:NitT/TauT family transport system permease protein
MSLTIDKDSVGLSLRARAEAWLPNRLREKLPATVAAIGALVLWQAIINVFGVAEYIAPSPAAVLRTFASEGAILVQNFWPTLFEALSGFLCGNLVAIALAVVFVHFTLAERAFYPLVVFFHTIPIIAVAPILVLLFGNGYAPKIMIAALISFFPMLVNMVRGLKAVNPQTLELMRVLSATQNEVFWKVRLQSSLPFLFSALKISSTSCVIGAIVGEWIGSNFGLGALIIEATYNFRSPLLYATVFVGAGLAVTLFAIVSVAERRLVRWKSSAVH